MAPAPPKGMCDPVPYPNNHVEEDPDELSRDVRDPDVALGSDSSEPPEGPNRLAPTSALRMELVPPDMLTLAARAPWPADAEDTVSDSTDVADGIEGTLGRGGLY
jgi:hypothetical protein